MAQYADNFNRTNSTGLGVCSGKGRETAMRGLMIVAMLALATTAAAQPVTGYTLAVYLRGGDAPTVTHAVPAAGVFGWWDVSATWCG